MSSGATIASVQSPLLDAHRHRRTIAGERFRQQPHDLRIDRFGHDSANGTSNCSASAAPSWSMRDQPAAHQNRAEHAALGTLARQGAFELGNGQLPAIDQDVAKSSGHVCFVGRISNPSDSFLFSLVFGRTDWKSVLVYAFTCSSNFAILSCSTAGSYGVIK